VIFTEETVKDFAKACPGCGERVEQDWVDVTDRPDAPKQFVPGWWACWTEGCEYGPPARPSGCICPIVDKTTYGDEYRHFELGGDPRCTAHARPTPEGDTQT